MVIIFQRFLQVFQLREAAFGVVERLVVGRKLEVGDNYQASVVAKHLSQILVGGVTARSILTDEETVCAARRHRGMNVGKVGRCRLVSSNAEGPRES
jgi:hypothetical protein